MQTNAVTLSAPGQIALQVARLKPPTPGDIVVRVAHSGISTGTEKLFWSGTMTGRRDRKLTLRQ